MKTEIYLFPGAWVLAEGGRVVDSSPAAMHMGVHRGTTVHALWHVCAHPEWVVLFKSGAWAVLGDDGQWADTSELPVCLPGEVAARMDTVQHFPGSERVLAKLATRRLGAVLAEIHADDAVAKWYTQAASELNLGIAAVTPAQLARILVAWERTARAKGA